MFLKLILACTRPASDYDIAVLFVNIVDRRTGDEGKKVVLQIFVDRKNNNVREAEDKSK